MWRPYVDDASRVASALAYSHRTRVHLSCTLPFPPTAPAAAEHAHALAFTTARMSSSPELAIPTTTAHRRCLHLAPSTASTSRMPCSPWLIVVRPPFAGIARRSTVELTGEAPLCGLLSTPLSTIFPCTQAPHCTAVALGHIHLPCQAGDAPPTTTCVAAPPCTVAVGFLSFFGRAMGTAGFARGWGVHWLPWPG
jgi:hypothetical protein